ncbi:MAG: SusC/RagA family TonB-linked outer membrane protein [Bacteroidales bacterium]|nr:SusC/RagA family TonB-linked outer membrane protein [Bacteroidales bacterium]
MSIGLASAQSKVNGVVLSAEDGQPIIGASVVVKGTTIGTVTNLDGQFSLSVPASGKTLVVSYVGMDGQELAVKPSLRVVLKASSQALSEVVVTALGITREKKSLGYAVQEVSGDAVNQVKSNNFVTSLSGKVAGINIKNNTNFGGSTNVIIRGASSLTGNNQALFVVDGIPVDNSNFNNSGQTTGRNGYDYGNSASDINPNDIESVSVLKGAAATALYGSRAVSGVVLITTKKGKASSSKMPKVKLSTNYTFSKVDESTFPKYQNEAGAGYGKAYYSGGGDGSIYPGFEYYADVNGDGTTDYTVPYYEDASRGQKFDPSVMVYQWDALYPESPNYHKATPWVAGANQPISFFETGISTSNNIEISGGDEKTTYRVSYTNFDQKGVMPNSQLTKNNILFNGSHMLTKNLKSTTSVNYLNTAGKGRPSTGYSDNIMSSFRQWYQVNVDMGLQKSLYEQTGKNISWNPAAPDNTAPAYWDNPYWVRYENFEKDGRARLIGSTQLDWTITSDLKAMARYSIDTYNQLQEEQKAVGSGSGEFGVGRNEVGSGYSRYTRAFTESNLDFMLNYHKKMSEDLDVSALLGTNIRRTSSDAAYMSTNGGLAVPKVYALSNSVDPMLPPEESAWKKGVNGYFGSLTLGYKDMLYLDGTLRRDQSSSLPKANNAYFYPSATTSFIFSKLVEQDWMSLGKIRLNYAQVGGDAPALSVKDTYIANAPFSGTTLVTVPNTKLNAELKSERQTALEAGLEMNFMNSRLGFDLSVYKNNTKDQLMPVSISYATGYSSKWVNAGEIQNSGVELQFKAVPVKTKDFSWDVNVNWAQNKNKVVSLYTDAAGNEVKNLVIGSLQGGVTINATVGEPYGTIKGSDFQYHANGGKLVSATSGRYLKTTTNDVTIGNINPDWTGGITNAFRYKNFTFSFLVDMQKGGDIFSLDLWYGMGTGLYAETAGLNDLGNPKRNAIVYNNPSAATTALKIASGYAPTSGGTLNPGVKADGTPNTTRVSEETYGAQGWAVDPNARYVYDASYIKLREVALSYDLPKTLASKLSLAGASVSLVGSNLWIISKNLPYADPEASQGSGNIQGWQSGVMPATRNFGVTLNLQF